MQYKHFAMRSLLLYSIGFYIHLLQAQVYCCRTTRIVDYQAVRTSASFYFITHSQKKKVVR
jgi:hypothetical protein